jgi:integrase/recombinase XerD
VTHLRKMVLEELQRRNYSQATVRAYLHAVETFAEDFHTPPDRLGLAHIRTWQAHLFHEKKLSANTMSQNTAALRFFFVKTPGATLSGRVGALSKEAPQTPHDPYTGRGCPTH